MTNYAIASNWEKLESFSVLCQDEALLALSFRDWSSEWL
jgi:hypothetical protein